MSHSIAFGEWTINFNGDFSGEVEFVDPHGVKCNLPFDVVRAVVAERVRRAKISFIEDSNDDELLLS